MYGTIYIDGEPEAIENITISTGVHKNKTVDVLDIVAASGLVRTFKLEEIK